MEGQSLSHSCEAMVGGGVIAGSHKRVIAAYHVKLLDQESIEFLHSFPHSRLDRMPLRYSQIGPIGLRMA